jgi:hypothetical protein
MPPTQRRTSTKKWKQVIGELRSMAFAVPGMRCLFCSLQDALRHKAYDVRLGRHVHAFLNDFRWVADGLTTRPTSIFEVIPSPTPATWGVCDTSGKGMGGVHFMPDIDGAIQPFLWRSPFLLKVTKQLVTTVNPVVKINNCDLELVGSVAQHDILSRVVDLQEITMHNCYDNTTTVYWQQKRLTTTMGPVVNLLWFHAIHQHHYGYAPLHAYIPGEINLMTDVASRSGNLTDLELLALFESKFPQTPPWKLCQLRKPMSSAMT